MIGFISRPKSNAAAHSSDLSGTELSVSVASCLSTSISIPLSAKIVLKVNSSKEASENVSHMRFRPKKLRISKKKRFKTRMNKIKLFRTRNKLKSINDFVLACFCIFKFESGF